MPHSRRRSFFETDSFKQSSPIILTSLVNKIGSIGMSLLPILLVERAFTTEQSSWIMSWIKGSFVVTFLVSGWLVDRMSLKAVVVLSFLLMSLGMGLLPFGASVFALATLGVIAKFGDTLSSVSLRFLLTRTVEHKNQKEALGWMRTANNLGGIFAYGVGALASVFGVVPLMVFDACTALLAAFVGKRMLPSVRPIDESSEAQAAQGPRLWSKTVLFPLLSCALILFGWVFLYEIFMIGVAGRLEVLHPKESLGLFSLMMVVNTVLCTLFAVKATQLLSHPSRVFPLCLAFTAFGLFVAVENAHSIPLVFVGVLFATLGELGLGALGQFTLIRLLPERKNSGSVYSVAMLIMQSGRVFAAALAFPWIVNATDHSPLYVASTALLVALTVLAFVNRQAFEKATR